MLTTKGLRLKGADEAMEFHSPHTILHVEALSLQGNGNLDGG